MPSIPSRLALGATCFAALTLTECGGTVAPTNQTAPADDAGLDAPPRSPRSAPCPSTFEIVAHVDTGTAGFAPHSLGVSNSTLFYAVHGQDPQVGIWAVPATGGVPQRLSSLDADEVWPADAETLLAAYLGTLYSVPIAGGAAARAGGLDPSTPLAGVYTVDATDVYFVTAEGPGGATEIWRLPRSGGAPVLLLQKTAADGGQLLDWGDPMTSDVDHLYMMDASETQVLSFPKSGGDLTTLETRPLGFLTLLSALGGDVFAADDPRNQGYTELVRLPGDGGAPVNDDAILGPQAAVQVGGSLFLGGLSTFRAPPGDFSGVAAWQFDTTTGTSRVLACTASYIDGSAPVAEAVGVAADATHVYLALEPEPDIHHWTLVRAAR